MSIKLYTTALLVAQTTLLAATSTLQDDLSRALDDTSGVLVDCGSVKCDIAQDQFCYRLANLRPKCQRCSEHCGFPHTPWDDDDCIKKCTIFMFKKWFRDVYAAQKEKSTTVNALDEGKPTSTASAGPGPPDSCLCIEVWMIPCTAFPVIGLIGGLIVALARQKKTIRKLKQQAGKGIDSESSSQSSRSGRLCPQISCLKSANDSRQGPVVNNPAYQPANVAVVPDPERESFIGHGDGQHADSRSPEIRQDARMSRSRGTDLANNGSNAVFDPASIRGAEQASSLPDGVQPCEPVGSLSRASTVPRTIGSSNHRPTGSSSAPSISSSHAPQQPRPQTSGGGRQGSRSQDNIVQGSAHSIPDYSRASSGQNLDLQSIPSHHSIANNQPVSAVTQREEPYPHYPASHPIEESGR